MTIFSRSARLAVTLLIVAAAASSPAARAADGPCRDDTRKLCASARPGGGQVVGCLKEHEADLSPACQAALPVIEQCAAELRKVCDGGKRRELRSCLRDNADKLNPVCRSMVPAR
jgi:hypothetical protein